MKIFAVCLLLASSHVSAWEDHPDNEDHKHTDLLIKLGNIQAQEEHKRSLGSAKEEVKLIEKLMAMKSEEDKRHEIR